jgi:hypothetical protein
MSLSRAFVASRLPPRNTRERWMGGPWFTTFPVPGSRSTLYRGVPTDSIRPVTTGVAASMPAHSGDLASCVLSSTD